jgi:hypothetical protein
MRRHRRLGQPQMGSQIDNPMLTQSQMTQNRESGRVAQAAEQTGCRRQRGGFINISLFCGSVRYSYHRHSSIIRSERGPVVMKATSDRRRLKSSLRAWLRDCRSKIGGSSPGSSRDATPGAGDDSLILVAAYSDSVEGKPKRLDDRDCLTPTALRRLRNQSTATWVGRRSTWSWTTVARPRSEPTLFAMSIGQHRCFGSKVSFVNTDRWSLESEVCTRVLPGTTAKWSS